MTSPAQRALDNATVVASVRKPSSAGRQLVAAGALALALAFSAVGTAEAGQRQADQGSSNRAAYVHSAAIQGTVVSVNLVDANDQAPQQNQPKKKSRFMQTAAGSVIGGLLGHQVGDGKGKTAATIAGVLGGGFLGNKLAERREKRERERANGQTAEQNAPQAQEIIVSIAAGKTRQEISVINATPFDVRAGDQVVLIQQADGNIAVYPSAPALDAAATTDTAKSKPRR